MALNVKTFFTRLASAAVFVAVLLSCVWLSPYSLVAFFGIIGFIGVNEFYKLAANTGKHSNKIIGFVLHALVIAGVFLIHKIDLHSIKPVLLLFILALPLYLLVELFKLQPKFFSLPVPFLSLFYVSVPCALLILLSGAEREILDPAVKFHPQTILGLIYFIWINDTGAYLVGSFIGKNKLYERISPNKTWEGTLGGIILCIAASYIIVQLFPHLKLMDWMVISGIVAVFGSLGDLVESMMKRICGVKDSGKLMPGHGGVLDRFDSLFFSAPFVFAYLAATGNL
ncbi:MAG: phosphatidate cytidylyltransferase [Bacteroidia bacterium]